VNRIPERRRPLFVLAASLVVLLVVAGGVLLVGRLTPTPTPTPKISPTSSAAASPSASASTPEGATRAFFEAFARARSTDDPTTVQPFVTGTDSSAYRTVDAFLRGQKEAGKASVITSNELSGFGVDIQGQTATVMVAQQLGGYDIDIDTGEPRESPTLLPPATFRVVLKQAEDSWLVDEFEPLQ
jgi:cytoskeletal protein RodZ